MSLPPSASKSATIDLPTAGRFLAGGGLIGGGASAIGLYLKHVADVKERAERKSKLLETRGRARVYEPKDLAATKSAVTARDPVNTTGTFMASTGAAGLGAYGAWRLVHHIYNRQRAAAAKKELDASTNAYLGTLKREHELAKGATAHDQFGPFTTGTGVAGLALILTALGSGVAAHKLLKKKNPVYKPNDREALDPLPRPAVKTAGYLTESVLEEESTEGLIRLILQDKRAHYRDSSLADLVAAAANGRTHELRSLVLTAGVDGLFDGVKGARHVKSSATNQSVAIAWLARDPLISKAIAPVVAAEFADLSPAFFKLAAHVPEDFQEPVQQVFASASRVCRLEASEYLCKQAGASVEAFICQPETAGAEFLRTLLDPEE